MSILSGFCRTKEHNQQKRNQFNWLSQTKIISHKNLLGFKNNSYTLWITDGYYEVDINTNTIIYTMRPCGACKERILHQKVLVDHLTIYTSQYTEIFRLFIVLYTYLPMRLCHEIVYYHTGMCGMSHTNGIILIKWFVDKNTIQKSQYHLWNLSYCVLIYK